MLLNEQEMKEAVGFTTDQMTAYRRIESAVLEKLKAQEPLGTAGDLMDDYVLEQLQIRSSTPLYTHPLPPVDVVRDAERYRFLSDPYQDIGNVIDKEVSPGIFEYRAGNELDAAIDAAMKEMK